MQNQDSCEQGQQGLRNRPSPSMTANPNHAWTGKWLVVVLGAVLASAAANANLIIDGEHGQRYTLTGGQYLQVFTGPASGPVSQIDISFYFSPGNEFAQPLARPSDFSLIVIAPGQAPQQWGGADGAELALYPGANHVADWSALVPRTGGSMVIDQTYTDKVTAGLGPLSGNGNWEVWIMNGFGGADKDRYAVSYQHPDANIYLKITLSGISTPVPEGFRPGETLFCLGAVAGILGFVRSRVRVA